MLGKTAGGLYWMFRFLERAENNARLVEAGFRIALTRSVSDDSEWKSVVTTSGGIKSYEAKYDSFTSDQVINFLLRDKDNPSSVLNVTKSARDNARLVRTALTTEVWTAVNDNWMVIQDLLKKPIKENDLPNALDTIRRQSALVRGALHGTMLRNDIYDFAGIGTFIERADNTARIIDVKYYTLLPSTSFVGSSLDNVQWETILRSVSAHRAFRWLDEDEMTASAIAKFLILDRRLPRSLVFSMGKVVDHLNSLAENYDARHACHDHGIQILAGLRHRDIVSIFDEGLHEFISGFIRDANALGRSIEQDYKFNG
jgi:uncharacterized alpha-E superfamily protein